MTLTPSPAYTVRDQKMMSRAHRYFNWQSRLVRPQLGTRVLEIGCGLGNFTAQLTDREMVVALDVDEDCVRKHRERFAAHPNITSLRMSASDPAFCELAAYRPDSAVCLNVLEHIEDDRAVLQNASAVLPARGRLVLIVPAFPALYGPIDSLLGHYRRYTRQSLTRLAAETGFRPAVLRYMNAVGFIGWWVNARIFKRTEQSERQIALFDSLIVPWLSRAEAVVPPPFGQSLFAVLEKDGARAC
jgi:SAM-dependent methyltransferase